jgi:CRP-like cAMP-binding protein
VITVERLAVIPFFTGVPPETRLRLAAKLTEASFPAGHTLFSEGEEGDALYFLMEGRVAIQKSVDKNKGTSKTLSVLVSGDFFGEMSLLEKAPRSASAITQEPSTVLSLPAEELRAWLAEDAKIPVRFFLPFVQSLTGRLRQTTREMILLFDVGGLLAQNLDATTLAGRLTEILARGFDEPVSAAFYLWNEFSGEYERVVGTGVWEKSAVDSRTDADPLFHWMAEKGECVLSGEWRSDNRFDRPTRSVWPSFCSVLAAPVMGERRPVGNLIFGHEREPGYFTTTQRRVLAGVVNLVAPAFENASLRLEKNAQERLARARQSSIDF